jgi:hypothetical protein
MLISVTVVAPGEEFVRGITLETLQLVAGERS